MADVKINDPQDHEEILAVHTSWLESNNGLVIDKMYPNFANPGYYQFNLNGHTYTSVDEKVDGYERDDFRSRGEPMARQRRARPHVLRRAPLAGHGCADTSARVAVWSVPLETGVGMYGWRFQATDEAGASFVFDVYRGEDYWHVHRAYE